MSDEIRIHITRRQARLLGNLLEADLVERGARPWENVNGEPPFPVRGEFWVPTEEENEEDEKLLQEISRTITSADKDPPPGA